MRTRISKILMCFAALTMLLMSAVPHHHHCFGVDHSEYICFASLEQEPGCGLETEDHHCHENEYLKYYQYGLCHTILYDMEYLKQKKLLGLFGMR